MALFKSLNKPVGTSEPFLDAVISMTSTDNTTYTDIKALKNSDVFTAVKIIASDIASSPIELIEDKMVLTSHDLDYLLNVRPSEEVDGWHFRFALAVNMLLNGNSFAEIIREDSKIKSLRLLKNSSVTLLENDTNDLVYRISEETKKRDLSSKDILHFRYFSQDGVVGISPLYSLKDELDIQDAGNKTLFNFFKRGINSNGVLKVNKADLDVEAKQSIRKKFEEANGSDNGDNAIRTIVLDETMDYKTLEINTEVLKLVNSTDWNTKQIAKVFGIPTDRLGVENQHSSTIQSNLMYLQNTLGHYLTVFTSELRKKLLRNKKQSFRFNTERLLETDPVNRLETTIKAVQGSLLTVNEGRQRLGLPQVEGGDRLFASLNYTYLDNLENYQMRKDEEYGSKQRETIDE
ncbi:phage portal protein [Enterococcus sp. FR169]|uniref:Phage portal protein n=1 Tax=Vagococcus martis TaxID=1768210 RepID=A0A1V4DI83_9ENTE|nr:MULTISPECIES: phage portal protein [Enterococcaceae]MDQ8644365.1 phage portal protein [Enterococcus sp. FR169]OPF88235.1 phage portal protein [Vagococcus martis]